MSDLQVDVPPHVAETIQVIALCHEEHHRKSTLAERIVDRATTSVGRPWFLLLLIGGAIVWVIAPKRMLERRGRALFRDG
jgi:hypothetical protein